MQLLAWNEDYVTGVAAVDAEHHKWMDSINRVMEEAGPNAGGEDGRRFFNRLCRALERQLAREEKLMLGRGRAGFEAHLQDHNRLRDEIHELAEIFGDAEEIDFVEVSLRLDAWFMRHFRMHDSVLYGRLTGNG